MAISAVAHNEDQVRLQWEAFDEKHCHVQVNVPDTAAAEEELQQAADGEDGDAAAEENALWEVSDHCQPAALTRDLKLLQFTVNLPISYTNDTTVRSYGRGTGEVTVKFYSGNV